MDPRVVNFADEAVVHCGPVTEAQVQAALDSGVWQGKAGGYNLFELQAAGWPLTVEGDETTVVGLPMKRVAPMLREWMGKKKRKIILEDTPKNRRLVVSWATLGCILPFSICALSHYCMCGHMAHESNHTPLGVANDVVWTSLWSMAVVFVGKSDVHGKGYFRTCLVIAVFLQVFMLGFVGILALLVVGLFAARSIRGGARDWSRASEEEKSARLRGQRQSVGIASGVLGVLVLGSALLLCTHVPLLLTLGELFLAGLLGWRAVKALQSKK